MRVHSWLVPEAHQRSSFSAFSPLPLDRPASLPVTPHDVSAATSKTNIDEFPDWLPPMLVKEFRQGMRARMFVIPFAAVHVLALAAVILEFAVAARLGGAATSGVDWYSAFGRQGVLWTVCYILLIIVLPLRAFSGLVEETGGRNVELLVTARLSRWRVVIGKWLVICSQAWLIMVSLAPYFIVRYFMGGFDVTQNTIALLFLIAANAATTAIVLGASGYTNLAPRLAITIGGLFILAIIAPSTASAAVFSLGSMGTGVIELWVPWIMTFCALVVFATYTIYGLQLGRARLRFALRPFELPSSRLVVVLIFVTPFVLLFGISCFILPGIAACGLLAFLVLRLDVPVRPKQVAGLTPAPTTGAIAPPPPPPPPSPSGLPRPGNPLPRPDE